MEQGLLPSPTLPRQVPDASPPPSDIVRQQDRERLAEDEDETPSGADGRTAAEVAAAAAAREAKSRAEVLEMLGDLPGKRGGQCFVGGKRGASTHMRAIGVQGNRLFPGLSSLPTATKDAAHTSRTPHLLNPFPLFTDADIEPPKNVPLILSPPPFLLTHERRSAPPSSPPPLFHGHRC